MKILPSYSAETPVFPEQETRFLPTDGGEPNKERQTDVGKPILYFILH